jgi:hypothetical protein
MWSIIIIIIINKHVTRRGVRNSNLFIKVKLSWRIKILKREMVVFIYFANLILVKKKRG